MVNFILFLVLLAQTSIVAAFSAASSNYAKQPPPSDAGREEDTSGQLNIAFVTGNAMKVREVEMIFNQHLSTTNDPKTGLVNLRVIKVDLPELQEVNTQAIAKEKAHLAAKLANGPCLVEDTSLHFEALGGMPGPFIRFFQERLKSQGLYDILAAFEDKSATAVCTLAFCPAPYADPVLFTGETHGRIVEPVPGRGFGWDSIFVPDGGERPFSAMETEEKNALSHRGKAVRQLIEWIDHNRDELLERQKGRPAKGHQGLNFKRPNRSSGPES